MNINVILYWFQHDDSSLVHLTEILISLAQVNMVDKCTEETKHSAFLIEYIITNLSVKVHKVEVVYNLITDHSSTISYFNLYIC